MKRELRKQAYREAAALLAADMDSADLSPGMTEEDESEVREFIRNHIVGELEKKGAKR